MAVISTASGTVGEIAPNAGYKKLIIELPPSADGADTFKVTLGSYGLKRILGVSEHYHTSSASDIELQTLINKSGTAVASGVLTLTLGTGTNVMRVFEVLGE